MGTVLQDGIHNPYVKRHLPTMHQRVGIPVEAAR